MQNLLRIIKHMKPTPLQASTPPKSKKDELSSMFPCLALPNEGQDKKVINDDAIINEAMASLEAFAPSSLKNNTPSNENKSKKRSRSRELNRNRSRSPNQKNKRRRSRSRSRHRSTSNSRSRRRSRSNSRSCRRSRSRDYKRENTSRDNRRHRSRERRRSRSGTRKSRVDVRKESRRTKEGERSRSRSTEELSMDPEIGKIYPGKVANIVPFGCFVQLESLKRRWEGLVHISQLRREGRVASASDVVSRGQKVLIKVLSISGQKVSLSMKDVDQETGRDLNPVVNITRTEEDEKHLRNPDRPTSLLELQANDDEDETYSRKRVQRLSSPEKWEIKQMLAANCIDRYN